MNELQEAQKQLSKAKELNAKWEYQQSIDVCKEIFPITEEQGLWEEHTDCLNLWSRNLWSMGEYEKGGEKASIALEKAKKRLGENHAQTGLSYHNLGICFFLKEEYSGAIEYFGNALFIRVFLYGEKSLSVSAVYGNLGSIYAKKDNYPLALEYYHKALNIELPILGTKDARLAGTYNNLGIVYGDIGDYKQSIKFYQKALNLQFDLLGEDDPNIANCYHNLGICYVLKFDFDRAIEFYQKALNIRLKRLAKNHPDIASSYHNLANCFGRKRDYKKAIQFQKRALNIRLDKLGETHTETASCYSNLGNYYRHEKNYSESFRMYQKALNIQLFRLGEKYIETLRSYNNLGLYYRDISDYDRAIQLHEKVLENLLKIFINKHFHIASSYWNIGTCFSLKGNYKRALHFYQKALENNVIKYDYNSLYHNPNPQECLSSEYLLNSFKSKGAAFFLLFQKNNFLKDLQGALFTSQVGSLWVNYIRQTFLNENSKLTLAHKVFEIFQQGIEVAYYSSQISRNDVDKWRSATEFITQINQNSFPKESFDYCWTTRDCLDAAFGFCEKSRAMILLSSLKDEDAKGKALISKKFRQREYDLKIQLNYYRKKIKQEESKKESEQNSKQVQKWRSVFFSYKQEYDALIEELEDKYPAYHKLKYNVKPVGVAEIQRTLSKTTETIIIQYFMGNTHIYVFVITATDYNLYQLKKIKDFEKDVEDFLDIGIVGFVKSKYTKISYQLYEYLLQPMLSDLQLEANSHLIIIPDGILTQLPFETLLTKQVDGNKPYADLPYLIIGYEISYHFSCTLWYRSWHQKQERERCFLEKSFIGFAPVYHSENKWNFHQNDYEFLTRNIQVGGEIYQSLKYSENEVNNIAQLFIDHNLKSKTYLNEMATIENFVKDIQNFKYILIAAHGDFQVERPELTGIIFSPEKFPSPNQGGDKWKVSKIYQDYILYLSDAYHLQLSEADLVVLSCCETGIGEIHQGEGTMALNRGFLFSGTKNIIYTLFKVYDEESSKLTQKMFTHILQGKSYSKALRKAKIEMIQEEAIPIYWSGYVLVGA